MSGLDFENIRPYYLRNLVMLINDGFISYDMITQKWVLMYEYDVTTNTIYSVVYETISESNLIIEFVIKKIGEVKQRISYEQGRFKTLEKLNSIAHEHTDSIDLLIRKNFEKIKVFEPRLFHTYSNSLGIQIYEMSPQIKERVIDNHTLLCLASDDSDIEVEDTDNFLDLKIEATDKIRILPELKKNSIETMAQSIFNFTDEELIANRDAEDEAIDRFVAFSKTLATANPNGRIISKEDKKRLDMISTIQEEINETYSEYVGRDIEFPPIVRSTPNTFVSEGEESELSEPFDKVLSYMIDKGILDRLEFNSGIYITLKSHMIIGTDVFVEAGISEMSFKNNTIKIKHMIGSEMEETSLDLSYVSEKIFDGDIYIRPFDMHKGKKIYTVKID